MSAPQFEERTAEFEMRATEDGDGRTLEGHAAVWDTPTRISGWEGEFDEQIARGAFKKTLRERMPVLQFDHGHDARTGSVPIGKIETLREDAHGLYVKARLFDNPVVEPIRQAIEGGAINGMSFRFQVVRDDWTEPSDKDRSKGAVPRRTVREVRLFELGPVVFPAYPTTSVGVREQNPMAEGIAQGIRDAMGKPQSAIDDLFADLARKTGLDDQEIVDMRLRLDAASKYASNISATSDDAARTSDQSDAAVTSDDAGTPAEKRVTSQQKREALIELRGIK